MSQNFIDCDRGQAFLMPPSLRDWLSEDHLAWFVIEAVGRLDLQLFYAAYRAAERGPDVHWDKSIGPHRRPPERNCSVSSKAHAHLERIAMARARVD
jgi:hypothetical protein